MSIVSELVVVPQFEKLTNKFNIGGTNQQLEYIEKGAKVKGGGRFLAYLGESPKKFQLNGSDAPFRWLHDGKLILNLAWVQENGFNVL
ncbi:stachyose synthetase [Vigna unguiculata]|uniref:Stachyose synthetase n=1 Tax=Vigna unguiculata TaxID=3917 RepID=A0A4D6M7K2_VIGUN|nr:stachyose synthetase [Vigna unguiculata]